MGKIILCTSHEKNIGVTSISLILGNTMANMLQKKILVVDLNINCPEFNRILSRDNDRTAYNIDTVMSYALSGNIDTVINGNVENMNNSYLEVLMGTNMKNGFKEQQYVKFLYAVSKLYDFVIVDSSLDTLDQTVIDYSDMILFFLNPSIKMINDAKNVYWKLLKDEKTFVLVNRYEKIMTIRQISEKIQKDICFKIQYDINIINCINKGDLNIGDSAAQIDIDYLSTEILKRYHMLEKPKWWERLLNIKKGDKTDAMA